MQSPEPLGGTPPIDYSNKTLSVTFTFARQWRISPAQDAESDTVHMMPPGGGLAPHNVKIAPVQLAGKSSSEVAAIVRDRARVMAVLTEAIAMASLEFSEALSAVQN